MKSMIHRLIVKHMVEINNLRVLFYSIKTAAYAAKKSKPKKQFHKVITVTL